MQWGIATLLQAAREVLMTFDPCHPGLVLVLRLFSQHETGLKDDAMPLLFILFSEVVG